MNPVSLKNKTLYPYLLTFSLITLFFFLCLRFPYGLQTDVAHQIKAIQQWLSGQSTIPNALVIPDPTDLSKDIQSWIAWWPPGVFVFFSPLIAIGLPIGLAARLTVYTLVIIGCCGWIKVAEVIQVNLLTRMVIAFALPLYTIGNALYAAIGIDTGDTLPFAAMPWLVLYTLHTTSTLQIRSKQQKHPPVRLAILLGLLLGSVYWLKYSAFLVSFGLFFYFAIYCLLNCKSYSLLKRVFVTGLCAISFLLPIILLTIINRSLTGLDTAVEQFQQADFNSFGVKGTELLITVLGGLGLSLFQTADFARSLVETTTIFSEWQFDSSEHKREALCLLLGIPATVLASWLFWRTKQFHSRQILLLWFCITLIPLLAMLYLSIKVGYNFLADPIARYSSAFIGFFQILLVASFIQLVSKFKSFTSTQNLFSRFLFGFVAIATLMILFVVPSAHVLRRFFIQQYPGMMQLADVYIPTQNQLFQPVLSHIDPRSVVQQINSLVTSSKDVIALNISVHPAYAGAWLEFQQRVLPLRFDGPLSTSEDEAQMGFKTSEDLRVILVTSSSAVQTQEALKALTSRFPQATQWTPVPIVLYSQVSIWFSDIKASS